MGCVCYFCHDFHISTYTAFQNKYFIKNCNTRTNHIMNIMQMNVFFVCASVKNAFSAWCFWGVLNECVPSPVLDNGATGTSVSIPTGQTDAATASSATPPPPPKRVPLGGMVSSNVRGSTLGGRPNLRSVVPPHSPNPKNEF